MVKGKDIMRAEAGIKYFLIQAVASIVVLLIVVAKGVEFEGLRKIGVEGDLIVWGAKLALAIKFGSKIDLCLMQINIHHIPIIKKKNTNLL